MALAVLLILNLVKRINKKKKENKEIWELIKLLLFKTPEDSLNEMYNLYPEHYEWLSMNAALINARPCQ